ncbi:MAG TPA: sensor histidine kinase [Burkholderiales bacterium]|nr:sensor histidine kinase [Burkholderiales bacterium]
MRLSQFITENLEQIITEWEAFAASLNADGQPMTALALRDHAAQILAAVAQDIDEGQTDLEQAYKSKGFVRIPEAAQTAAMTHGALRYLSGFDLRQLAAEYRALRASVLRLWLRSAAHDETAAYQMTRFNEAIDQALAESIANYSDEVARSRDTFLAILGHDLRSPLSAISNSALYLGSPGLLPGGAPLEAVRRINAGAVRMSAMIRDLLEYTRSRLGRSIPISPQAGSLATICTLAYDEVRAAYPEQEFRLEIAGNLEGHFDGERLHQVLSNLLHNAIKHSANREPIILSAHGEQDRVTVKVQNYGRPIPPDQLQVIFNPLVQIPSALVDPESEPATSLGLGLYIAHEIVTRHGGTIVAESSEEGGTVFSTRLPRIPPAARAAAMAQ